ncbi:MAG TPA: PUA domain-containing protein [Sulfolobales archaeon]|nr:PUA domain-containing protein [Sulfolobales archaeon]
MRDRKEMRRYREKLLGILSRAYRRSEISRCIPQTLEITCNLYPGICIVTAIERETGLKHLYAGSPVGIIINGEIYPYPDLLQEIYRCTGDIRSAVEAGSHGVKAYLYGNDLLVASVEKIYRPFRRGDIVGVIDTDDGHVIGVGRALLDPAEILRVRAMGRGTEAAVENIFDLGWFLRVLKPIAEEY